ncbi:MAG: DUF2232 domain-containing protein [Epulopiscium sp.]|nr:DUF2232 domain-containing protein [Candidatus Epulonipiscium sp.]
MDSKQKEFLWMSITIGFYILTGYIGVYNISQMMLWPIFAVPMSLVLIKTRRKELIGTMGIILSIIISFINTGTLDPMIISAFLLFILIPSLIFGTLYCEEKNIPKIIIVTTVVIFLNGIIYLIISRFLGTNYLEAYYNGLDKMQNIWNKQLSDMKAQNILPDMENAEKIYAQTMAKFIRQAKRTYPAMLFIKSLITSTIHLFLIQLIAKIRSWQRPEVKEIYNVKLSSVSAWVFMGLWLLISKKGDIDSASVFAAESMLSILFALFQIIGFICLVALIKKLTIKKVFRVLLIVISVFWLIFNPILLAVFGFLDSLFNFRKVDTLI